MTGNGKKHQFPGGDERVNIKTMKVVSLSRQDPLSLYRHVTGFLALIRERDARKELCMLVRYPQLPYFVYL